MAGGYSVTITAVDRATKKINAINKEIANMRAPVDRLQKSLSRFADLSGITKLSHGMGNLARTGLNAFQAIGRIVEPLAAITSAVSIAGMFRLVTAWSQFGTASLLTARRIGMSVEQLGSLQGAAELSGSTADALTTGLETLGQTLYDAVGGRAPQAVVMLNTLGISFRDTAGHARSVTDVLPELADKIASMSNPYDQLRAATALLGGSARDLLPFLQRGSAGIAEYNALALHYGVNNEAAAEAARQLRLEQVKLNLATKGLTNSIALALAPTLGPLLDHMAEWIQANKDWIATDIGAAVKRVGDYIEQHDWKSDVKSIEAFAGTANDVATAFGGWKNVLIAIMGLKFVGWLIGATLQAANLIRLLALIPGSGVGAAAAAVAAGGAVAGAMNTPFLGPDGQPILGPDGRPQNWGGLEGQRNAAYAAMPGGGSPRGSGPGNDPQSLNYRPAGPRMQTTTPGGGLLGWARRRLGIDPPLDSGLFSSPTGNDAAYKPLLDLIGKTEGTDRGRGYDETVGYGKYTGGPVDLQHKTLKQIDDMQTDMVKRGAPSSAVGRYEIIQKTLRGLVNDEHLSPDTLYSKALQDHLAATLARRRGGDRYLAGRMSGSEYQGNLGMEWASIPEPGTGRSFYPGQGVGGTDSEVQGAISAMNSASPPTEADPPSAATSTPPANVNGGTGAAPSDVTHTVNGQANVNVHLGGNVPPGTTTNANTSGALFDGPPRVHYAMDYSRGY